MSSALNKPRAQKVIHLCTELQKRVLILRQQLENESNAWCAAHACNPALWEVEAGGQDQESKAGLGYTARSCLNTCTPMFIAALFTIAKLWKQPRCPTTDEWIKKMWYLYTMEFYAAMKKNEMLSFAGK
jgi:hypothetical protein